MNYGELLLKSGLVKEGFRADTMQSDSGDSYGEAGTRFTHPMANSEAAPLIWPFICRLQAGPTGHPKP